MRTLCLPANQIYTYVLTGKFKALDENWKHAHSPLSEYELFVLTEGTLYLSYNGENFTIKSGEYLLLPPCSAWRDGFKPSCCSFYWLHFSASLKGLPFAVKNPEELSAFPPESYITIPQTGPIPKPEKLVVLMKQLQDQVKSQYPAVSLNNTASCILSELYGQQMRISSVRVSEPEHSQIYSDIVDYVKTNLSKNITVAEIASKFGYNEKYISHRFAQITGMSLKQYILSQKVDAANFMLTDSNTPIAQIALSLGFSNSQNFSRLYKKLTGLSPSEYRNAFEKRLLFHV